MSHMPASEDASSQVRGSGSVTAPVDVSEPAGSVTSRHYWPAATVAALRDAGLDEDAATWEKHFRERGEWRETGP
jgi:hypothetical protein